MSQTHTAEFIAEMKAKLLEHKTRLETDLSGLSEHTEIGDDMDESAEEVATDELNRDLIARMKSDLEKIEAALARIEAGTYGVDDSGQLISEARLRAIPWADKAI